MLPGKNKMGEPTKGWSDHRGDCPGLEGDLESSLRPWIGRGAGRTTGWGSRSWPFQDRSTEGFLACPGEDGALGQAILGPEAACLAKTSQQTWGAGELGPSRPSPLQNPSEQGSHRGAASGVSPLLSHLGSATSGSQRWDVGGVFTPTELVYGKHPK